jgi:L-fuculose-phosphate aldolase
MTFLETYKKEVEKFLKVCHKLAANKYVTGFGGNLAWRLESDLVLITPTMMNKGEIQAPDLVFINLKGEMVEGTRKPTGERLMYLKFFTERPDVVSVLHCHAPNIGAFAIGKGKNWLMRPLFPETATEVGPVPVVPYAEPLTEELARNFSSFLPKYNSFIMENHGLVTMSNGDIEWTLMNVELLEMTAYSILMALKAGFELKEISREGVRNLDNVMKTRNAPYFGVPGIYSSLDEVYYPS